MRKHPYFSHDIDAHNDEKILSLRAETGLEGYGFYWMIIEIMASQEDYCLNVTPFLEKNLSTRIGISVKKVSSFLEILKNFELISENSGKLFSNSLLKRMNLKDNIAKKNSENISKRWHNEKSSDTTVLPPKNVSYQARTVKERKGNIKENKLNINTNTSINKDNEIQIQNSIKEEIQIQDTVFPLWLDLPTWEAFLLNRKYMKSPASPAAQKMLLSKLEELRKDGNDPTAVMRASIENNWRGFFPLKKGTKDELNDSQKAALRAASRLV